MNYKIKYYWEGEEPEAIIRKARFEKQPRSFKCIFEAIVFPTSGKACFQVLDEEGEILCSGSREELTFKTPIKSKECVIDIYKLFETQILKNLLKTKMDHKKEAILEAWQYFKTEPDTKEKKTSLLFDLVKILTPEHSERWQVIGKTDKFFDDNHILMDYQFKRFSHKHNSFISISL